MPDAEHTRTDSVAIARLQEQVRGLYKRLDRQDEDQAKRDEEIKERLDELVTRHEFSPIQKIAYGLVAIVLTAVVAALVATVVGGR